MTLNLIPAFKEANPGVDVHYFCDGKLATPDALGSIMRAAGVDLVLDAATLPERREQYDRVINLIGYPLAEGYPERPMQLHLLQYFALEMGLQPQGRAYQTGDGLPALTLRRPMELQGHGEWYATLQPRAGWSKYKEWNFDRWAEVVAALSTPTADWDAIDIVQIGAPGERMIPGVRAAHFNLPLSQSIAVFANARMHIGIDSFCNHLTNYMWTYPGGGRRVPGVILWGSTQAGAAGYPDNINISKGLTCQPCFRENPAISRAPRGPCVKVIDPAFGTYPATTIADSYDDPRPHACMDAITVDEVVATVREMWERVR